MSNHWRRGLKEARLRLGLPRVELARRANLSPETVRAYEEGRRRASVKSLKAILDALKLERGARNEIFLSAGFAPDGLSFMPEYRVDYSLEEAAEEVERYRWPAFVANEMFEVVAANRVAQRLWGVDLRHEFTDPVDRNLLSVVSSPRFADRLVNWDEAVGVVIGGFKGHTRGPESPENPSPYFAAVLERFLQGDVRYVRRFLELWETIPPSEIKRRWSYRIVWQEPGLGRLQFHCFTSSASDPDGLAFSDWVPLDATTWHALDLLAEERSVGLQQLWDTP